jgi:exo-beta-1,3-glucanase (GH17 family)
MMSIVCIYSGVEQIVETISLVGENGFESSGELYNVNIPTADSMESQLQNCVVNHETTITTDGTRRRCEI